MRQLLRNIAEIGAGQGAPQGESNYCDYGIPFVKAGNLQELTAGGSIDDIQKVSEEVAKIHKLKLYPKGTVLFAKSGMSCLKGYVYTLPQDAYVVSHLACITPKEDISEYLRLYFTFHRPNQLVKDAAYPSISLADIGNLEIDTRDEQTREHIILTLRSVEEIIAIRKQELSVLDDLIKARFVEMFGDIIRNNKGWPQYVFSDIATSRLGKMLDAKQQTGKYKYPYLANFNVQWFRFELENLNEMDFNEADQVEFQLNDGDLLVCEGGEIGREADGQPDGRLFDNAIDLLSPVLPLPDKEGLKEMIRLACACRNIRVRRTTGKHSESIMSRRTLPAPTLGSWSISPTRIRVMVSGTAFRRLSISILSIMEHSSTISTSP